jgi:hypothetical protein
MHFCGHCILDFWILAPLAGFARAAVSIYLGNRWRMLLPWN